MNIIGKTTISPFLFYSGKISGYITWILLLLSILNLFSFLNLNISICRYISYFFLISGLLLSVISLINLGKSTRLGIPSDDTIFKSNGIYKFSRNPMYLGFNCFTIASMLFTLNVIIIIMGIYSIIIYHLIIIGEEKFLEERFQEKYIEYKKKVRRYL